MRDAIGYATGATINNARCLKPDPANKTRATSFVVISITLNQAILLKDSIRLFSCPANVKRCSQFPLLPNAVTATSSATQLSFARKLHLPVPSALSLAPAMPTVVETEIV